MLLTPLGLLLCAAALAALRPLLGTGSHSLRAGPWPGLTARGALVLLDAALLLAGTQLALGQADVDLQQRSAPAYVPLASLGAAAALALTARVTRMPGALSAACGAYLLPRGLLSLLDPRLAAPAQLLVPAMAFDLILWVQARDIGSLGHIWPASRDQAATTDWPEVEVIPRPLRSRRAAVGGAVFGALLGLFEPAQSLALGANPAAWTLPGVLLGAALAMVAGSAAAWAVVCVPAALWRH